MDTIYKIGTLIGVAFVAVGGVYSLVTLYLALEGASITHGKQIEDLTEQVETLTETVDALVAARDAKQSDDSNGMGTEQPDTAVRTFSDGHRNPHCQETATPIDWPVDATEGWQIVTDSVKIRATVLSSNSTYFGVQDLTEDGFNVRGNVVNNGECIYVLGSRIAKDGRGSLHASGTYTEVKIANS